MLAWMIEEKNIEPNVQVWDKPSARTTAFRVAISTGMKSPRNTAAPTGNVLHSEWRTLKNERSHVTKVSTIFFRSRQTDYAAFPMKAKYCPNTSIRKIVRSVHVEPRVPWLDALQQCRSTCALATNASRSNAVAHLKRILKLARSRLRSMSGATDEFTLAAAQCRTCDGWPNLPLKGHRSAPPREAGIGRK